MADPKTAIDALLELDPASFARVVEAQDEGGKAAIRAAIQRRLAALDKAAWGGDRKMRGYKRQFDNAKYDYERLDRTQQWLAAQFHEAFATIYRDPAGAAAACWAYEQAHGPAETGRVLRTAPHVFGDIRGWSLFGLTSGARKEALLKAATFDFSAYRLVFNLAAETGKGLLSALQETAQTVNGKPRHG
jgi:hypothetical protein